MNKRKPKKYIVVLAYCQGLEPTGIPFYYHKYVSAWPTNAHEWGARFEISPSKCEALKVGRDTALEMANTIRMRNAAAATVMVEEA